MSTVSSARITLPNDRRPALQLAKLVHFLLPARKM
jgi:hypothetical protein